MSQNPTSSRRRVIFAHHPRFEIVATIGDDHNLLFWDTERRRFIFSSYLGLDKETTLPTAMRFSHNGDYLIIGYSDGLLIFLDSKISKSVQSKSDEKYTTPNLSLIKKEKAEEGHAVLNM